MSGKQGNTLDRAVTAIIKVLSWFAAFFLVFMTVSYTVSVVGRYFFNAPLLGAEEIVDICMVGLVYLALSYTALNKGHIAVDLITAKLPGNVRRTLNCFASLVGVGFWGLVGWQAGMRTWDYLIDRPDTTDILNISLTPFVFVMTIGCLMLVLRLLLDCYHSITETNLQGGK
jgi:TRAP-type C4-dicarboxylate transport system permease small subunit